MEDAHDLPGWFRTRASTHLVRNTRASIKVVQTTSNGVNLTVTLELSRPRRQGLATDEGVFLVVLRDGAWKVQARSMMGT